MQPKKTAKTCLTCKNLATRTTNTPSQFLIYGCKKLKLNFGLWIDLNSDKLTRELIEGGIKEKPKNCKDYDKR